MAVADRAPRAGLHDELDVPIRVAHVRLDGDPARALEPAQPVVRGRGFRLHGSEVVGEDEIVEVQVPPAPVVELHFRSGIVAANLFKVPLVGRVARDAGKLARVVAELQAGQVAHGAVVPKGRAAGVRSLGVEREIAGPVEERPPVQINVRGAAQLVGRIDEIGDAGHPVVRPFGPAAVGVGPRRIERGKEFDRVVQPVFGLALFAQHGKAGGNQDGRHRTHGMAVKGKEVNSCVLDGVVGDLPGAGQESGANRFALAVVQIVVKPVVAPGEGQNDTVRPFVRIGA